MPIDRPREGHEQGPSDELQRIETDKPLRDAERKQWDAEHDPSPEFEQAHQELPERDRRPGRFTVDDFTPAQRAELEESSGKTLEEILASRDRYYAEQAEQRPEAPPELDGYADLPRDHVANQLVAAYTNGQLGYRDTIRRLESLDIQPNHADQREPDADATETIDATIAESEAPETKTHDQADAEQPVADADVWGQVDGEKPDRDAIHVDELRQAYILDGNGRRGGGHLFGTGLPGKTEFPASWDDEKVIEEITELARNPDRPPELQDNDRWKVEGTREGVEIRVILEVDGKIWTAHPLRGAGVVQNDQDGNPVPKER